MKLQKIHGILILKLMATATCLEATQGLADESALPHDPGASGGTAYIAPSDAECRLRAEHFGEGGSSSIGVECTGKAIREAPPEAVRLGRRPGFKVYGRLNHVVFVITQEVSPSESVERYAYLAGSNTGLTEIVSLTMDEAHRDLYVLDRAAHAVLVFSFANGSANVAPHRKLALPADWEASSIEFDPTSKHLAVASPNKKAVLLLSLQDGPAGKVDEAPLLVKQSVSVVPPGKWFHKTSKTAAIRIDHRSGKLKFHDEQATEDLEFEPMAGNGRSPAQTGGLVFSDQPRRIRK